MASYCPLIVDNAHQFPIVLVGLEYQAETAPVHAVVTGIEPGEVVFHYDRVIIDFKLVFQGVAAAEHLVVDVYKRQALIVLLLSCR